MSALCPQTLPRRPAKVSEGSREENVRLTCHFTLTGGGSRAECEAECEPDTALITQRSQVQILPPATNAKPQFRGSFSERSGDCLGCVLGRCQHDVSEWTA